MVSATTVQQNSELCITIDLVTTTDILVSRIVTFLEGVNGIGMGLLRAQSYNGSMRAWAQWVQEQNPR